MDLNRINEIAREIQWKFEADYKQAPTCFLSEKTCMVLALETYAGNLNRYRLRQDFSFELNGAELRRLKKILHRSVETYLSENIKTLALH